MTATRLTGERLLVAVLLLVSAAPALAGRPLVTEDAGVLERGECELEGVVAHEKREASLRSGQLQLGCGTGWQSQLAAFIATARSDGERSQLAGVTGKTALLPLTEEAPGLTIAYTLGGSRPDGHGWRYDVTTILAVVTWPVRPNLLLHANAGASRSRVDSRTDALWATAAEWLQVGDSRFDLMAEVFGTQRDSAWVNLAVRYTVVPDRFSLNGSLGAQGGTEHAKLATLGFKLSF